MHIRLVVPLRGFAVEDNNDILLGQFTITNNIELKNKIVTDSHFISHFGQISKNGILDNYILFYTGESSKIDIIQDCRTFKEVSESISRYLINMCTTLWFIADTPTFISVSYIELWENTGIGEYIPVDGQMLLSNTFFSNSRGEYLPKFVFTAQQLSEWNTIYNSILRVVTDKKNIKNLESVVQHTTGIIPNKTNYIPYDQNRIYRAILFLQLVRTKASVIMKITFQIAIYECLFTSGSSEVTHQVSERASLFLGGTSEEKKINYALLKSAYDIRSNFVHGNKVKGDRDSYLKIAVPLDELTRKLLNKVITDPTIFLSSENNTKEFNNHFYNLIFVDDPIEDNDSL